LKGGDAEQRGRVVDDFVIPREGVESVPTAASTSNKADAQRTVIPREGAESNLAIPQEGLDAFPQ
jgi:hypothetical protein